MHLLFMLGALTACLYHLVWLQGYLTLDSQPVAAIAVESGVTAYMKPPNNLAG